MSTDPLATLATAFGDLAEGRYKAELELSDRYQTFMAEVLRLALLGIGAFGFLFAQVFAGVPATMSATDSFTRKLAGVGVLAFGAAAGLALAFRYCASEAARLYLDGLRYSVGGGQDAEKLANNRLTSRATFVTLCIGFKFLAALMLAAGAVLTASAFFRLLW